jgi:hypothetical protein
MSVRFERYRYVEVKCDSFGCISVNRAVLGRDRGWPQHTLLSRLCVWVCLTNRQSSSVVSWLACLSLQTMFADSNPDEDNGFLTAIETRSTPSFRGKWSRRSHGVKFYDILKIPAEYDRHTSPAKLTDISLHICPYSTTKLLFIFPGQVWWMNQGW